MIHYAIQHIEAGKDLALDEVVDAFATIIEGKVSEDEIASFLLALNRKGPSIAEVAGAAMVLRRKMTPIRTSRTLLLDTCGTGGDQLHTFNISTTAALVTAAAGVPVAKHGNRAASSRSGSADVLAALGVNVEADVACVERCLEELGICFCYAPLLHQAMRHVGPVRKKLGVPTIFNILGPLVNPASAPRQLLGVGRAELRSLLAEALILLGSERSVVVHGSDGLDEVTLSGATVVADTQGGAVGHLNWTPGDFGMATIDLAAIRVSNPDESAAMIAGVLDGLLGPARDIVVVNAAAALWTAGFDGSLLECAKLAAAVIDSGKARDLLNKLRILTHS